MPQTKRGALICFEGCDRCGKSTQVSLLESHLTTLGVPNLVFKFPDRSSPSGILINEYLKGNSQMDHHVIHLLFSANRWESMEYINDQLNKGVTVLMDRYVFSGVAYSHSKGLDLDWCLAPDKGLLKPDIVLFMDVDPIIASQRGDYGDEIYEKLDFQKLVYSNFMKLHDLYSFNLIDGSGEIQKIHKNITLETDLVLSNQQLLKPLKRI